MTISAIALFCEDIREEKSGSDILIGVMTDNLNLQIPVPKGTARPKGATGGLSKLGIYVRVVLPVDDPVERFDVTLKHPEGTERALGSFSDEGIKETLNEARKRNSPIVGFIFKAIVAPFLLPQDGRLEVHVTTPSRDLIAGILNVTIT